MKLEDKVSVIVPVYNTAKHLEKCINSILKQTYVNIEIIIINDGSTDESMKICERLASKFKNILVINQKNNGPSAARNNGISVATGKYIQFVDSDDTIELGMTEELVNSMSKEMQLVICGYKTIYLDMDIEKSTNHIPKSLKTESIKDFFEFFGEYFEQGFINSPWNKLYYTDLIKKNRIYFDKNVRLGEDLLFNLLYMNKCKGIRIINKLLYNYVAVESGSLTRSYKKDLFSNQKMIFQRVEELLVQKNAYNIKNKVAKERMYLNAVIMCFENTVNKRNGLSTKEKLAEINIIVNDETVKNNVHVYELEGIQNITFKFLIIKRLTYTIFILFSIKGFMRKNFKVCYSKLKKLMK